jgi:hypothetical protein
VPGPQWFPGDLFPGAKVNPEQNLFVKPPIMQSGVLTNAPTAATPGTVATGGTVSNSLGYDVVVYASATTGIQAAKVGTVSIPGSVNGGNAADYIVPGNSTITLTYTGTLSWVWQAK